MHTTVTTTCYKMYSPITLDAAEVIYREMKDFSPLAGYALIDGEWHNHSRDNEKMPITEDEARWLDCASNIFDAAKRLRRTEDATIRINCWVTPAGAEIDLPEVIMAWACHIGNKVPNLIANAKYITKNPCPETIDKWS